MKIITNMMLLVVLFFSIPINIINELGADCVLHPSKQILILLGLSMTSHSIKFYPVGNGDTCQIITSENKRILLDYRQHAKGTDSDAPLIDLAKKLRSELFDAKRSSFDVVAFTHADKDHIEGSTDFFYLEHAKKYQSDDRIKINELWVPAAMIIESAKLDKQSNEFVILRQEARHRLKENKGIKIFSKPDELVKWMEENEIDVKERSGLFVDAGTLVPGWNIETDNIEFFCHSPYKKHVDDSGSGKDIRNSSALIFNIRFKTGDKTHDFFAVGDSEAEVLEDIVNITKYHKNDDRLTWDLFKIPHHCSYLGLTNGDKGKHKTAPLDSIKELLELGKENSYMISSSLPMLNNQDAYDQLQPPHIQAKNTYKEKLDQVGGRKILVTMEEPNKITPKPIVIEFSTSGISYVKPIIGGAAIAASSKPTRAGRVQ